ncbi:inositol monophosphatase family protein [Candidatus Poriferisocius sp.]|uniref:inositol monophosphatase family protein n=1 Tax=Candidatus Poriferisocius sp. TaxID=3101276 RepID=UPI003B01D6E5
MPETEPSSVPAGPEWDHLEKLAAEAAEVAASLLRAQTGAQLQISAKSSRTDLVTDMDVACEAAIVEFLTAWRPDDAILGEEGSGRDGTTGVRWIIDPIDGTVNFVHGHPGFGVSVAAEAAGQVVAGAVIDPMLNETFTAHRGGGARVNGSPIHVRPDGDLALALVATGFSYAHERRRRQAEVLGELLPVIGDIRRVGGAAVDLCSVACGRVDAFFEVGLNPWDYAAGVLICEEAGAIVQDLNGGAPSSDFVFAASPGVADTLLKLLKDAEADQL